MRNTLMDKIANTVQAMDQGIPLGEEEDTGEINDSPMFEDTEGLDDEGQTQAIEEHLDSLPEDDKEFLAAHLSTELAKVVGIVTGSMPLEQYLESIANPKIALIPIPRDKAQAMMEKYKMMQSEQQPQEGQPTAQPPITQPQISGAMGQPM